jgi:hypothetical protein
MTVMRGSMFAPAAYALGKMLDHSGWKLDRGITPSDFDMAIDNDGSIMFCELSSWASRWAETKEGQRRLYRNAIRDGKHCAVLCRHPVKPEEQRQIDSCYDIESFEVMFYDFGPVYSGVLDGNAGWQWFVKKWIEPGGPIWLRRLFLGRAIGMKLGSNGAGKDAPDATPKG